MCFSATVSYSAAAVLLPTGVYALRQAQKLQPPYWVMACIPIFFGLQQGLEGRVWQSLDTGVPGEALPFALGFHFFSHFLWLWWIPLSSYLVESSRIRKKVFLGFGIFGFLAGAIVYFALLLNPEWLSIQVEEHSLVYDISAPYRGPFSIGIPDSAIYGLVILVPLLFSSHRQIRYFGVLVVLSIILASAAFAYAFVSVWCFFAAVLSLYLVVMLRRLSSVSDYRRVEMA